MADNRAGTEAYEAMIQELQKFKSTVSENCALMQSAAAECAENMPEDPAAAKASAAVGTHCGNISAQLEVVDQVIRDLQEEIEEIQAAAAKADEIE